MPILETSAKLVAAAAASATGGTVLAAVEAVAEPKGAEGYLTLTTGAVLCTITLFTALKVMVDKLLRAKDDQIDALRAREKTERERADKAEQAHRDELAARAQRAEAEAAHGPPPPPPRQSRRDH